MIINQMPPKWLRYLGGTFSSYAPAAPLQMLNSLALRTNKDPSVPTMGIANGRNRKSTFAGDRNSGRNRNYKNSRNLLLSRPEHIVDHSQLWVRFERSSFLTCSSFTRRTFGILKRLHGVTPCSTNEIIVTAIISRRSGGAHNIAAPQISIPGSRVSSKETASSYLPIPGLNIPNVFAPLHWHGDS